MPTSTFQEQGTLTLVPVASLPEERRCQSRPGRACVLDGWPRWCNELESRDCLELLRLELRLIVFDDDHDVKKDMALVFSCFVRSLKRSVAKRLVFSKRNPQHREQRWRPRPRAEDVLCKRAFLSAGKLTDTSTGIAIDEKQLISWARTNRQKK